MAYHGAVIGVLLLILGGCTGLPESRLPLSSPGSEPYDQRILGWWFGGPPDDDRFSIHLKARSEPNMLDATSILIDLESRDFTTSTAPEITWTAAIVHPSHMGGSTYYNISRLAGIGDDYGADEDRKGYIIVRVDLLDDHRLKLCVMDSLMVENAIEEGIIRGSLVQEDKSKNIQLDYHFIDASRAELREFILKGEGNGLFDACLLFQKTG